MTRLGAMTALALMPVMTYALGRFAWEQAQALITSPQLTARAGLTTFTLGEALTPLAAAAGALVAAHLTWTALVLMAAPRTSRARTAVSSLTPAAWRRLVTVAATGALSVGLAFPATAAVSGAASESTDAGWVPAPAQASAETTDAGWVPMPAQATTDNPNTQPPKASAEGESGTAQPASASALSQQAEPSSADTTQPEVVVVPGDTLWDITADQLDLEPSEHAAIAAAWPKLYEENRDKIGADPGLIVPEQHLTIPAGWSA